MFVGFVWCSMYQFSVSNGSSMLSKTQEVPPCNIGRQTTRVYELRLVSSVCPCDWCSCIVKRFGFQYWGMRIWARFHLFSGLCIPCTKRAWVWWYHVLLEGFAFCFRQCGRSACSAFRPYLYISLHSGQTECLCDTSRGEGRRFAFALGKGRMNDTRLFVSFCIHRECAGNWAWKLSSGEWGCRR